MFNLSEWLSTGSKLLTDWSNLCSAQTANLLKRTRHDLLNRLQGVCSLSQININPLDFSVLKRESSALKARFNAKPGYALYNNTVFYICFKNDNPSVTALKFKQDVSQTDIIRIQGLFPPLIQPIYSVDIQELDDIRDAIEPLNLLEINHIQQIFSRSKLSFNPLDPIQLKLETTALQDRFECKPGYALFENSVYFISFEVDKPPTITSLEFKEDLSKQSLDEIKALFPDPSDELHKSNDAALTKIREALKPPSTLTFNITFHSKLLKPYFIKAADTSVPFIELDYNEPNTAYDITKREQSREPTQVAILKQGINALYYLEQVFEHIESISVAISYTRGTIHSNAHKAISLVSEFDIDFARRFKEEVLEFMYLIERFNDYSTFLTRETVHDTKEEPWSYDIGYGLGFAIRHMYAPDGHLDIHVLSQFAADLPIHIDTLTTMLNDKIPTINQFAPNINEEKVKELQKEATKLLKTLKHTQANASLGWYQIINYLFMIRQIYVLLATSLTQIGQLHNSTQELLRTYLDILKNHLFPKVLAIADKAEIEFMLDPGCLSSPLMRQIKDLYQFLTSYAKRLINFSNKGGELLVIEDSSFMRIRHANIQTLINRYRTTKIKLGWVQEASTKFFSKTHQDRSDLSQYYCLIEPHLKHLDQPTHEALMKLISDSGNANSKLLDNIDRICEKLTCYLARLVATEDLCLKQAQYVIQSINKNADLQLFPYHELTGCDIGLLSLSEQHNLKKLPEGIPLFISQGTNYYIWGNTNGHSWALTTIDGQYIHKDIISRFTTQTDSTSSIDELLRNRSTRIVLPFDEAYDSLYQQMILKKAHTQYRSMLDVSESDMFIRQEKLSHLICMPIDWLNSCLPNPIPLSNMPLFQNRNRLDDLLFDKDPQYQHSKSLVNPKQLTPNEALSIHVWYENKIQQLAEAYRLSGLLLSDLHTKFTINHLGSDARTKLDDVRYIHSPMPERIQLQLIDGCELIFKDETSLQKECRDNYSLLQPYLTDVPSFSEVDPKIVNTLSTNANPDMNKVTLKAFKQLLTCFLDTMEKNTPLVEAWKDRSKLYVTNAKESYTSDLQRTMQLRRSQQVPRSQYILQSQKFSQTITQITQTFLAWLPVFSEATELNPSAEGVPYRNISEVEGQLSTTPSALFIKRIGNTLYHLKEIAIVIESLSKIQQQTTQNSPNGNIDKLQTLWSSHMQPLIKLGPVLYRDPYISKVKQVIGGEILSIISYFNALLKPHTPKFELISPHAQTIKSSGLQYSLHSLYILSDHILHLTSQQEWDMGHNITLCEYAENIPLPIAQLETKLTLIKQGSKHYVYGKNTHGVWRLKSIDSKLVEKVKVDFTQVKLTNTPKYEPLFDVLAKECFHTTSFHQTETAAKQAALYIEDIIKNSHSYFKLLWNNGRTIYYLNQELRNTIHRATQTTHDAIMSHLEIINRSCLTMILLNADLQEHNLEMEPGTTAFWLNKALNKWFQGLLFSLKVDFSSKESLVCDDYPIKMRLNAAFNRLWTDCRNLPITYEDFSWLKAFLHEFQTQIKELQSNTPTDLSMRIQEKYKKDIIPILSNLKSALLSQKNSPLYITDVDPILELTFDNTAIIENNLKHVIAYLSGQYTRRNYSRKQIHYLQTLQSNHNEHRRHYRETFANHYFDETTGIIHEQKSGLSTQPIHMEYTQARKLYFAEHKNSLINKALFSDNIDTALLPLIETLNTEFKQKYLKRFETLDTVLQITNQFTTSILNDKSLSEELRKEKLSCLDELKLLIKSPERSAKNLDQSLNRRLDKIKKSIYKNEKKLLEHEPWSIKSLDWIITHLIALLSVIGLYTPERQKHYTALKKSIEASSNSTQRYFNFFYSPEPKHSNESKKPIPPTPLRLSHHLTEV